MPNRSDDRCRLLDSESVEAEVIDYEESLPPITPPPSYDFAIRSTSNLNQSVSSQNSAENHIPVSSQPLPTLFYGYNSQPAEGHFFVPGDASAIPGGQPVFVIPVTVQPTASGQPLAVYENENYQNLRTSDREDEDNSCKDCCFACLCCLETLRCLLVCGELMAACSKN